MTNPMPNAMTNPMAMSNPIPTHSENMYNANPNLGQDYDLQSRYLAAINQLNDQSAQYQQQTGGKKKTSYYRQ